MAARGKKRAARGRKAASSTSKSLKFTIPARPDTTKPEVTPESADTPALDLQSYNWNFSDLPDNIPRLDNETLTNPEEDTEVEVTSPQPSEEQPSEEQPSEPLATKQVASPSPAPVSEPDVDSTSEASITPPPVAKKGRKAKAPAEVDGHAVLQAQSTSKMILSAMTTLTTSSEVVLFIPHMSGDANKRKTITATHTFDDALGLIHETIGCADVMRKPELSYKLSDSAQKSSAIGLESEEDWAGLCEEVVARQRKKKMTISVEIIVRDNVRSESISCDMLLICDLLVHALLT
jgi:hypothetical protein